VALCQPGDEVVIPAPYYTSYPDIVGLSGASSVILNTSARDDYLPDEAALEVRAGRGVAARSGGVGMRAGAEAEARVRRGVRACVRGPC
jgi:hypothetical protein